jgi:hypothetical protein
MATNHPWIMNPGTQTHIMISPLPEISNLNEEGTKINDIADRKKLKITSITTCIKKCA